MPSSLRDLQAEFDTPTRNVEGASIVLRPDAISMDYLTAVTPGPEDIGVADTAYSRVWKARATAGSVYLSRGAVGVFEAETLVFNYSGVPIIEMDCAFEQAGRVVIAASRATGAGGSQEIWIYWYDPLVPGFAFQNFGAGRTPRCLLDVLDDTTGSDVLVFYIADATGATGTVCFRQQRDRYAVQYLTAAIGGGVLEGVALPSVANLFLEDVIKARSGRVVLLLSVREAGRYRFTHLASTLYPFFVPPESWRASLTPVSGALLKFVITVGLPGGATDYFDDIENWKVGLVPQSGVLAVVLILHTTYDIESWQVGLVPQSGALVVVIIAHTTYDIESWKVGLVPQSGVLAVVIIVHVTYDIENWKIGLTPQSGTLV